MNWFSKFLTSSIGQKLVMSLTGLFLVLFLVIHLIGNLQLLKDDMGQSFNVYAEMMAHNPFIKVVSISLYFFIILHAIQGLMLWQKNKAAKGVGYAVNYTKNSSSGSRVMAWLGILIFLFLLIHMGDFWFKMKFGELPMQIYDGVEVKDLYIKVLESFKIWWIVLIYLISMVGLAFHLLHGFQSAFQTLGFNHPKYSPIIKTVGLIYAIVVPLGFAIIPIWFFLWK